MSFLIAVIITLVVGIVELLRRVITFKLTFHEEYIYTDEDDKATIVYLKNKRKST